jgi:hypothetical protein
MAISNNSTGLRPGVCTSTTRPTNPYEGFMIYETDTDLTYVWGGSAWQQVSGGTAVGNSGLVYITSVSVTSGSSISINNCFTSAYDNYHVVASNMKSTSNAALYLRLRSSSTDNNTGYQYGHAYLLFSSSSWNTIAATNANAWVAPGNTNTSPSSNGVIDFYQPAIATQTGMSGSYQSFDAAIWSNGSHTATTSYDGFSLVSGGTFSSGTVTVYGYRK